jgi:hypothetical protein
MAKLPKKQVLDSTKKDSRVLALEQAVKKLQLLVLEQEAVIEALKKEKSNGG